MGAFERSYAEEVQIFCARTFANSSGDRVLRASSLCIDGRFIFFQYTPYLGQRRPVRHARDELRQLVPLSSPLHQTGRIGNDLRARDIRGSAALGRRGGGLESWFAAGRTSFAGCRLAGFAAGLAGAGALRSVRATCAVPAGGGARLAARNFGISRVPVAASAGGRAAPSGGSWSKGRSFSGSATGMKRSMCSDPTRLVRKIINSRESEYFVSPALTRP